MAGVTENGFESLTRDEIVAEINTRMKEEFGDIFDVTPESPDGHKIGIMADFMATQWKMAEASFNSYNPATAIGIALDSAVRLNGIKRIVNSPTEVVVQISASNSSYDGTIVPKGSVVETIDGIQFETTNDASIPSDVVVSCLTKGAIEIGANQITKVVTEIVGWDIVNNPSEGVTGVDRETDTQLRARRERSVVRTGTDTAQAIASSVGELNIESVLVIDNDTAAVVDGIPANSFHTIVDGGLDIDVANKIFNVKPIGIPAFGNTTVTIKDSQGIDKNISFSRPTVVEIEMEVTVKKGANAPTDADDLLKSAMRSHIDGFNMGDDVKWSRLFTPANSVPNVDAENIRISRSGQALAEATIEIGNTEKAYITEVDIAIVEV
jgi:uncharacterized phage protein gp47/JayE